MTEHSSLFSFSFRRSVVRLTARILRVPVHFGRIVHGDDEPPFCEKCGERHYHRTHPFRTLKQKRDAE